MNALYCSKCESDQFDFIECRGGISFWQCKQCKEMDYDHSDLCSGG